MNGVVTLLPQPFYHQVEQIWDELEADFGFRGIRVTPYPHFSWQIGETYDMDCLEENLHQIARRLKPIQISTAGLGVFTGEKPVVYISVVRTAELTALHAEIWSALDCAGKDISPLYSPSAWMPHISLIYNDLTPENIGQVLQRLAFRPFYWQLQVDNFAYIHEPNGTIGQKLIEIPFQG